MKNQIKKTQSSNEELMKRLKAILHNIKMDWMFLSKLEDVRLVYENRNRLELDSFFIKELEEKINSHKDDLTKEELEYYKNVVFWLI